jgi:hypothetical protein
MNRINSLLIKAVVVLPLLAIGAPAAQAQVVVGVGVYPPAAYIATSQPEYFEGRPHYWYNNHWYYRDGNRWSYYRSEPGFLHERRSHWGDRRVVAHGRPERVVHVNERYHYRR